MRRPPVHEGLLGKRIQIQANLLTEPPAYRPLDHIDSDLCRPGNMAFIQMSAHYRHIFSAGSDMAVEIGLPVHFRNISNQGSNLHKAGKFRPPILLLLRVKKPQRNPSGSAQTGKRSCADAFLPAQPLQTGQDLFSLVDSYYVTRSKSSVFLLCSSPLSIYSTCQISWAPFSLVCQQAPS